MMDDEVAALVVDNGSGTVKFTGFTEFTVILGLISNFYGSFDGYSWSN